MSGIYRFGRYELQLAERRLLRDEQPLTLRPRAFELLLALVEEQGRLVTKQALLDRVWPGLVVEESNVQVQISGLRRRLGPEVIATVPGLGYRLALPVRPAAAQVLRRKSDPQAGRPLAAAALPEPQPAVSVDRLFGREDDIVALLDCLATQRLVTVLGAGGTGKTRVAQEVARRSAGDLALAVVWVDLAPLTDARELPAAVAEAAGVDLPPTEDDPLPALQARLQSSTDLLVLDNCEHLVGAVSRMAAKLLQCAPRLRLLSTSQERLQAAGEQVYRLQPLAVPPQDAPWQQAQTYGALQMLVHRARAADPNFALDPETTPAAVALVRRLDGVPLAIEMAAARIPQLGLAALCSQLADWARLLRSPQRDAPLRQSTLRATLEWSHSLLAPREQVVLRRLAPFVGSFTLPAAQPAVAQSDLAPWDAMDALADLADKSLLQAVAADPPRYRLLETTRLLALEQLAAHGETLKAEQAHGEAMATLAETLVHDHRRMPDRACRERYEADYADLQAAFDRACRRRDVEVAALTGSALTRLDYFRNLHAGRRRRAEALHALLPHASPKARAWSWHCIASHGMIALKTVSRHEASHQAVLAWRALDEPYLLHYSLCHHAAMCGRIQAFDDAERALAEAQTLERDDWPARPRWFRAAAAAVVLGHRGDVAAFRAASEVELKLAHEAGVEQAAAWVRLKLADAARVAGELEEAVALGSACVAALRALKLQASLGLALCHLAAAWLLRGQTDPVPPLAAEALPLMWDNDWAYLCQDMLALLAALTERPHDAARLLGCADGWYQTHRERRLVGEAQLVDRVVALIEPGLGAAALADLRAQGAGLREAQARDLCQAVLQSTLIPG